MSVRWKFAIDGDDQTPNGNTMTGILCWIYQVTPAQVWVCPNSDLFLCVPIPFGLTHIAYKKFFQLSLQSQSLLTHGQNQQSYGHKAQSQFHDYAYFLSIDRAENWAISPRQIWWLKQKASAA